MKKLFKSMSILALFIHFVFQNSVSQATKILDVEENFSGQILPRIQIEDLSDKESKSLFSYVLRRCLFKCVHFIVQTFISYTTKKRAYTQVENSFKEVPDEIFSHVLRHLSARDLSRFSATSKQLRQQKANYQNNMVNALISLTQRDCKDNWLGLVDRQCQAIDPLERFNDLLNTPFKHHMIRKITADIAQKNQCAFVLKGSPLNLYLNQALLIRNKSHQHSTGFVLYQHHKAYFDQELFPTESHETYKAIMAQHLFSKIALYAPRTDRDTALNTFFNCNKSAISKYLKDIDTANNYIQFSSSLTADQLTKNHHIVITDDQLSKPENKKVLSTLLSHNPDHKLVLDVGSKFVKNGCLNMKASDLPEGLAHLILTNTAGHATSIGDHFLNRINLKSFDTAGLTKVTSIRNYFLFNARELQSFNTVGLTNVTSIGTHFLAYAQKLQSLDSDGLTSLTLIKEFFLFEAQNFQSFGTTGLISITLAKWCFLDGTSWSWMNRKTLDAWKKHMML